MSNEKKPKTLVIEAVTGRGAVAKVTWGGEQVGWLSAITIKPEGIHLAFVGPTANATVRGDAPVSLPVDRSGAAEEDARFAAALRSSGQVTEQPKGEDRHAGMRAVMEKRDRMIAELQAAGFACTVVGS
jgi:hypothetical protein